MSPTHQDDASMRDPSLARSVTPFQIQDEDEDELEVDAQFNSIRPDSPLHLISDPFQDFFIGRRQSWDFRVPSFNECLRRIRQDSQVTVSVKSIVDGTPVEVARSPFAEALGSPGRFGEPDVGARNISPSRPARSIPITVRDSPPPAPPFVSFKYIIIIKDFTKYNIIFSEPGLTGLTRI